MYRYYADEITSYMDRCIEALQDIIYNLHLGDITIVEVANDDYMVKDNRTSATVKVTLTNLHEDTEVYKDLEYNPKRAAYQLLAQIISNAMHLGENQFHDLTLDTMDDYIQEITQYGKL